MEAIKKNEFISTEIKINIEMLFQQVKTEFKNEKLLMYYLLFFLNQHVLTTKLDIVELIDF